MNILLLTTKLNLGGIGVYTTQLAKSLKKTGENVVVASSGGALLNSLRREAIEHIYIPIDTSADIGLHTLTAYSRLSSVMKGGNIHIIHAQTRVAQIIASLLCRKYNAAMVSTCHGFFKNRLSRRLFPCWGRRVIAISDAVREHLVNDMSIPKEKVALIYNGVDVDRFSKRYSEDDKSFIRKEYGLKDGPVISMIARMSGVKGHRYLFGAAAKLLPSFPGLQLLIVGGGPAGYLKALKRTAQQLGIIGSVVFHDACADTSVPLSVTDILCSPSLQEGLGLAILEAMAMGIPVVASDVGGIYTLIKHKHNGLLVPPRDEGALAGAIAQVLNNPSAAHKMGRVSTEIVKEKFTIGAMIDRVLRLYDEAYSDNSG